MAFDKIKQIFNERRDNNDLRNFTPQQKQRIFDKIANKEREIISDAENQFVNRRIQNLESQLGIFPQEELSGVKKFRQQRLNNLANQKKRNADFKQKEKDFRDGKLKIKPVGPKPAVIENKKNLKLNVRPLRLRAPPNRI